jgi:hypothetical protein
MLIGKEFSSGSFKCSGSEGNNKEYASLAHSKVDTKSADAKSFTMDPRTL